MRIVNRYIFKEIAKHSLLGLGVFTFFIFVPQINRLLAIVARKNVSLSTVVELFLLPLPGIFTFTLPIAVLVGTLIGLSRMASDGEIIALRAAGMGASRIARPALVYAFVGWLLASTMSLYWAPRANRDLDRLKWQLQTEQAPYEIQPRVFLEKIPKLLIFVGDTLDSSFTWRNVFIADRSNPEELKITTAATGSLGGDARSGRLTLQLTQGSTHEIDPEDLNQYSLVHFNRTEFPLNLNPSGLRGPEAVRYPALPLKELWRALDKPEHSQGALVELHYRLAIPMACIVLALVGIPLGLQTQKGGKSVGFILIILLVMAYYFMAATGLNLSKQGRVPPWFGLWVGNVVFGVAGLLSIRKINRGLPGNIFLQKLKHRLAQLFQRLRHKPKFTMQAPAPRRDRFLQIMDGYVLRSFFTYLGLVSLALMAIFLVFDFYQLFAHILKNKAPVGLIFDYYRYLIPQALYFPVLPLSILVSVLISFSLLAKSNQLTAFKAAGVSLYRLSFPLLAVAAMFSVGLFLLEENYLPQINQQQDALRNQIKGKPPQTYLQPGRHWIFGEDSRIFNYRFFDPDRNLFARLSVFELNPETFEIRRRIYAERAHWEVALQSWVLENGWVRDIDSRQVTNFRHFQVDTFPELTENPEYFKKEVKPYEQMNAFEFREYMKDLQQSGFDVGRLSVQFHKKFSYPLMALVVTLIGIPFSFKMGSRGALSGIALGLGIALVYWSSSSFFEAMGALGQLPPVVAGWASTVIFSLGGTYLLLKVRT
ncbi:MAG: LPS export ABC transporter permease LptF [Acidobacteria bacterium]|nr:LPS export ABC transporter permease LptF [Acidobacteriota bacterium]